MNTREIWDSALGQLQLQVSKSNYRTWLEKTSGVSFIDSEFTIGVPNTFIAEYLEKNQRSLIEKTLISIIGKPVSAVFIVGLQLKQTPQIPSEDKFNPCYSFESFLVGGCNKLALAAAQEAVSNPGLRNHNPLVIYGGSGLGKTHLLHAIAQSAGRNNRKATLLSAERYTNKYIFSLRNGTIDEFRNRFNQADMFLIDDIQFLAGKPQTEESFFHIFNALHDTNRQIVATCNQPPKSIAVDERLRSRLEWGLCVNLLPPDRDTRLSILQSRTLKEGLLMEQAALEFIAGMTFQNIRELEGAMNKVLAYAKSMDAPLNLDTAKAALEDCNNTEWHLTPERVLDSVSHVMNVPVSNIQNHCKDHQTVLARQVAMYVLRNKTTLSLQQIGRVFDSREAITVSQGCKKIEKLAETDAGLKQTLSRIQDEITRRN